MKQKLSLLTIKIMKSSFFCFAGVVVCLGTWPIAWAQDISPVNTPANGAGYTLSGRILEKGNKNPVLGGSLYIEVEAPGNTLVPGSTPVPQSPAFSAVSDLKRQYQLTVPAGIYP